MNNRIIYVILLFLGVFLLFGAFLSSTKDLGVSKDNEKMQKDGCIITGCSSHICADEDVITTCEFRPEYVCYQNALCKRDLNNQCGWEETKELSLCLSADRTIPQPEQIQ